MIKCLKRGNDMEKLIMVASGKEKADIVFKNAGGIINGYLVFARPLR